MNSSITLEKADLYRNLLFLGSVSLLSGHSGVGKSTLVNKIQSGLNLKTSPVSEAHNQGQHTTTFAEMFELDNCLLYTSPSPRD